MHPIYQPPDAILHEPGQRPQLLHAVRCPDCSQPIPCPCGPHEISFQEDRTTDPSLRATERRRARKALRAARQRQGRAYARARGAQP